MVRRDGFVGSSFLVAMVASPSGGGILEAALGPGGTRLLAGDAGGLALGVGLEMVNVIAVLAIAVGLYPLFRLTWDGVVLGFVAVRVLEATFLALPIIGNEIFPGVWLFVRGFSSGRRTARPDPRRVATA